MPQKRQCSRRLFLLTRSNDDMASSQITLKSFLQQQEGSPSALTGGCALRSLIGFLKALRNLVMWLNLMLVKYPTINYFGKECMEHSKVKMNHITTCTLRMMRFSRTSITLTSGKSFLISVKALRNIEEFEC